MPEIDNNVFFGIPLSDATLYVPASALEDYKAADQWRDFGTILSLDDPETGIDTLPDMDKEEINAPFYTLGGLRVSVPVKGGIYIRNGKKVVVR